MNICGNCKYWGSVKDNHELEDETYKPCGVIQMVSKNPTALAVVQDGSNYYAALKTKEDFGCNLHQLKEN